MKTIADFLMLLSPTEIIELGQGDYLFRQNDIARGMYLIKTGRLKLVRDSIDGNAVVIHIARTNDSLAEASLFSSHYHCNAKTDTPSQVFLYHKEQVLSFLSSNPSSALEFIKVLAKQIQKLRLLVELRAIRVPRERFLQYLRLMVNADRIMSIESTYKDLALTLGMTHETLYRVLGQLEKDKVIARQEKTIILKI